MTVTVTSASGLGVVLGVVVCITLIRLNGTFSASATSGGGAYMSGVMTLGRKDGVTF